MKHWEELEAILRKPENSAIEFKEAKNEFSYSKLKEYCSALANGGGGFLVLGVDDKGVPSGTNAFPKFNDLQNPIYNEMRIKISIDEYVKNGVRVLVFGIPPRPKGITVKHDGVAWMRNGSSLVKMDDDTMAKIFRESEPDFSCEINRAFLLSDIDEDAIKNFRKLWSLKSSREEYLGLSNEKTLRAIGLMSDKGINNAAVILFGKKEKIDELIPCSEIIFEWRNNPALTNYDFRKNWREPFFRVFDDIWNHINMRNSKVSFQEGLFQRDIYIFSEKPVREALLNAVTHRDYTRNSASTFIKASPDSFTIESPGGFLPGITPENVLDKQEWRNRCIAETFEKAGLVERSGQGINDIFSYTIKEGKGVPDFSKSDKYSVVLKIPAQIKDKEFVSFLDKLSREANILLSFEDICELENIRENRTAKDIETAKKLINLGIIEKIPAKRNQYILCKKYYSSIDKKGQYTKIRGLKRKTYKTLILEHIDSHGKGSHREFVDAMPNLSSKDITNLLMELSYERKIKFTGSKRKGHWIKIQENK